jgi:hypothetical protein
MQRIFEDRRASIGLVIGTFAAVPYVHLHLESRKRHYPSVLALVHDDGSPFTERFRALCERYYAEYYSPPQRIGHQSGDLAATLKGLEWGRANGLDITVKMSRTFIPITNPFHQLQQVAWETQYATFSNICRGWGLGFRSECVGFHTQTWHLTSMVERIREAVTRGRRHFDFVEIFLHKLAREVQRNNCEANQVYEEIHPRAHATGAYGLWEWMGQDGTKKQPGLLWHRADQPFDYYQLALAYGLTEYRLEDFSDPNQNYGIGPAREW